MYTSVYDPTRPELMKSLPKISPILACILLLAILAACAPAPQPPAVDPAGVQTQIFQSALLTATFAVPLPSATPAPTATPVPPTATATPVRTPPALPAVFQTDLINKADTGHTYIKDTCEYLKDRWDPNKSAPGTVVLPIMFHSIVKGEVTRTDQISAETFKQIMRDLQAQGFKTITTDQLAGFLERNEKIPPRSMILIVDDRHYAEYYEEHFLPFLEESRGTVTNAWISIPDSPQTLLDGMARLINDGWVDVQAHGVVHNLNIDNSSTEDFIHSELFGSIDFIQQHFGKRPIAYIWPGGSFSKRGVEVARQAGYQLGFTINPRGPIMFNWVPLAGSADPGRPSFIPEGAMDDPLMTLPRYWDTDVVYHIDTVRQIGKAAADYANSSRKTELEYYDIVCQPVTGPIPEKK